MDEGGKREGELRTELRPEGRTKSLFQGAGAHHWILERRNVLARRNYNRLKEDDRFSGKQILAEAQWRLIARV